MYLLDIVVKFLCSIIYSHICIVSDYNMVQVKYEDGDSEELTWKELESILLSDEGSLQNKNEEKQSVKSKTKQKKVTYLQICVFNSVDLFTLYDFLKILPK